MNPVLPNLKKLKEDIVLFKQQFSHLRSDCSPFPNKLTLQCLQCLPHSMTVESSIELSDDPYETFERFKTHLMNIKHKQNVSNLNSIRIHCTACNGDLMLPNNYSGCQNGITEHLKSSKHDTVYRTLVGNAFNSLTSRFTAMQCNMKELDVKLDGIIGKLDLIMKPAENVKEKSSPFKVPSAETKSATAKTQPVVAKPQPLVSKPGPANVKPESVTEPPVKEVNYPKNTTIICNACKCPVSSSHDHEGILDNVGTHLRGQKHGVNISREAADKSLWCCLCQFSVLISEDWCSAFDIMEIHLNGCRHSPDEDGTLVICNACESPITSERDWGNCNENKGLIKNIWDHLHSETHNEHISVAINKSFWCSQCDTTVPISENWSSSYWVMNEHINHSEHLREDEFNYKDADVDYEENDVQVEPSVIICNVCQVVVAASYDSDWSDSDSLMNNLMDHLDGHPHGQYIWGAKRRSLWCSKCNYPIKISEDLLSSQDNISQHINTSRHTKGN